jgi:hypothetical protein
LLVQVAGTYQQLQALANQASRQAPLRPALVASIRALQSLVDTTIVSGSTPGQQPVAVPTISSLVARVAAMQRMLAELRRLEPSAAARLAPTVRLLHAVLAALLRSYRSDTLMHPNGLGFALTGLGLTVAGHGDPMPRAAIVPTGPGSGAAAPEAAVYAYAEGGGAPTGLMHARHQSAARATTVSAADGRRLAKAVRPATSAPGSSPLPASAPATGALVIAVAVCLRYTLSSSRLALAGVSWRSALPADLLDRPG